MRRRTPPPKPATIDVPAVRRTLARNVRRLRLRAGLTLDAASERAGLHLRSWQKVEYEETNTTVTTLARVAAALDVPVDELFSTDRRGT